MFYRFDISSQESTKFVEESDIYMPIFYNNGAKGILPIGDNILEGNLLVEGCTRSGKTTVLIGLAKRLRRQYPDALFVFFDPKRDFLPLYERGDFLCSFYEENRKDCKFFKWNLLKEAMESQYPEDQLRELIGALFDEDISNSRDPFFMKAAKEVFIGYCMTFIRRYTRNPQEAIASNKEILELLNRMSVEQLRNRLSMESDNKRVIETLIPTVNGIPTKQAQGVLACLTEVLTLFCGTFAGDGMDTVSGLLKESGNALFLEYDYGRSHSANTFYRLFLKLIIENKLSINSNPNKKVFLILDEGAILGDFDLSNSLNIGGGLGLRTVLACQSTAQLSNLVPDRKEYLADGLIAGFASVIAFRINDAKSLETIQKQFGEVNFAYYNFGLSRYEHSNISIQKESTVLSKELTSLNLGEAYVKIKGAAPVRVKFIKED